MSNAPCSWGIFYAENPRVSPDTYLAEVARAGYEGTELGPLGFLPTDPEQLVDLLGKHNLVLEGGVHCHTFSKPETAPKLRAAMDNFGPMLTRAGASHLVLMDEDAVYPADALGVMDETQWAVMMRDLEEARRRMAGEYGITVSFHPHVGTAVEREAQIDRLLDETGLDLCFDTGHHAFWPQDALAYMKRCLDRIAYIHLKNVDPVVRQRVWDGELGPREAFDAGVMCPLPEGAVDIKAMISFLETRGFDGPVVVEQDFHDGAVETPEALAGRNAAYLRSA